MDLIEIKKMMNKQVYFNNTPYILTALIIKKIGFEFNYRVSLKDIKAKNSYMEVPAEDISLNLK